MSFKSLFLCVIGRRTEGTSCRHCSNIFSKSDTTALLSILFKFSWLDFANFETGGSFQPGGYGLGTFGKDISTEKINWRCYGSRLLRLSMGKFVLDHIQCTSIPEPFQLIWAQCMLCSNRKRCITSLNDKFNFTTALSYQIG